jgi:predicted CoA-binding protein
VANWEHNLVSDDAGIRAILEAARRVAVLGIKTEAQAGQPAIEVPRYLAAQGYEVVPVPVYYPEAQEILGQPVYRRLQDVPGEIDLVDVFRRPQDIPPHLEDIIAARPKAVWFQLGIRNDAAAERLAAAGIRVVQDRCTLVEHRRLIGHPVGG